MIDNEILHNDADQISEFLLTTPGIHKDTLGQFLGKKDDYNIDILNSFASKIDYRNLTIDEAMRLFLSRFRLPGEAQQIERIIEAFSNQYYQDHLASFKDSDSCYFLAFSLIFLNTMLHNSNVAENRKMTRSQFIKTNLEKDAQMETLNLGSIYDSIKAN